MSNGTGSPRRRRRSAPIWTGVAAAVIIAWAATVAWGLYHHRPGAATTAALGPEGPAAGLRATSRATDREPTRRTAGAVTCGVERWRVKTLQDRPALRRARAATIGRLDGLPVPAGWNEYLPTRLPAERREYTIRGARIVYMRAEADGDIHAVLAQQDAAGRWWRLIAEFPDPACAPGATARQRARIDAARRALLAECPFLTGTATVTGVAFFDARHGQVGVAANGIELHPVLAFHGSCA